MYICACVRQSTSSSHLAGSTSKPVPRCLEREKRSNVRYFKMRESFCLTWDEVVHERKLWVNGRLEREHDNGRTKKTTKEKENNKKGSKRERVIEKRTRGRDICLRERKENWRKKYNKREEERKKQHQDTRRRELGWGPRRGDRLVQHVFISPSIPTRSMA